MEFDAERTGTGTAEWAEVTENICRGCANNCLYCYAAHNANRFGLRKREEWDREELTKRADMQTYPAKRGVVMFPSSHDITPFNLDACVKVLKLILRKGNRVLIVTKPRVECITALVRELMPWQDQVLFRFTIGSMSPLTCKFWEPGAPSPIERLEALQYVFRSGFKTSVSIEPMLAGIQSAIGVAQAVYDFVTDTIWIGKMNKARLRVPAGHEGRIKGIESMQSDTEIMNLYLALNDMSKIRWKDSIKEVVARMGGEPK
jgi:DNA repair photolyase